MTTLEAASLLLIVADVDAAQVVEVHACADVAEALDLIAAVVTHPDEELDAVRADVGAAWDDGPTSGDRPGQFTMRREVGAPIGRFCSFAMFPVELIGSSDLPDARR